MKLKRYAELIARLAKDYPEAEVVYGIDFEGNEFRKVDYGPSVGIFNEGSREYEAVEAGTTIDLPKVKDERKKKINACCVN